jgi:two-component system alkaline phosphatase synthesis response regulator PhoP
VDDQRGLRLTLTRRLNSEGYEVETAADGDEGFTRASTANFDLVVLDVMMPGRSGFDVCRDLRRHGVEVPVLMLTARGQVADRVVGLKLGADDYLTKPFDMAEFLARVESCMRRRTIDVSNNRSDEHRFGSVRVDFRRAEVERDGIPIRLSAKEWQLLRYFVEHRGVAITRDELLDAVWGFNAMVFTRTVDVHVATLRKKIEPEASRPQLILTLHGIGYKFAG